MVAVAALLVGLTAGPAAFAQSLTIQGKVLDGSNNPVSGNATQFRVQILANDASKCVLFDETHTVDMSATNGLFSINLNDGNGTTNLPNTYTLEEAISNRAAFAVNSTYCQSGSGTVTYTPGATDNRKVVIQFRDPGTMTGWESIPEMDLNPMAYAMESRSVGGYPASSLLRVVGGGVPGTAPTLTAADVTELQALVAGTSGKYLLRSTSNGAQLPNYSGSPSTPTAGSIWFDTSGGGSLKYYDGTTVQTIGTGSGSGDITGVTAGTGLTGGGLSGGVTLALDTSGVTAASYGSATAVPVLTVDAYGRITAATTATIGGTLPTGTSGQFLKSGGGSSWAGASITMADLKSTIGGADLFSSPGCTAAQTLYWDSGTDQIKCQGIAIGAGAITSGTIADARLADVGTAGTYKIVTTDAKGRVTAGSNPTTLSGFGITDAVVNAGGVPSVSSGVLASRPAFGTAGRLYLSTDNLTLYRDNGSAWDIIGAAGGGTSITEVSAGTGLSGGGTSGNVTLNLSNVGTAGTYTKVTTDAQGRVTAGTTLGASDIPALDWAKLTTGKPTTLSGYGITDSLVQNAGAVVSFQAGASGSRPAFGTAGRFYYSTNTNVLSYDTGTAWTDLTQGSSAITSVAVTAPITNSGTSTAPNITLAQANGSTSGYLSSSDFTTFSNKLSSALTSAMIWVGNGSNVATPVTPGGDVTMTNAGAFTVTKLQNNAVASGTPTAGHFLKYSSGSWGGAALSFSDLQNTSAASAVASAACSAAQTLYYDTTTKELKCQNIAINASAITAGQLAVANGGTGAATTSQYYVFAGPTGGSGAPSFRALTANDLPASASYWQSATGGINFAGGRVGVGTTAPASPLHVVGSGGISFADTGSVGAGTLYNDGGLHLAAEGTTNGNLFFSATNGLHLRATAAGTARTMFATDGGDSYINAIGGNVGIGTTTPAAKLDIVSSSTAALPGRLTRKVMNWTPSANNTTDYWANDWIASYDSTFSSTRLIGVHNGARSTSSGSLGTLIGAVNAADNTGTGAVNTAQGSYGRVNATGGGSIAKAMGFYSVIGLSVGSSIAESYGLYVDTLQGTKTWGVYVSDVNAKNYFGGKTGIGTDAPTGILSMAAEPAGDGDDDVTVTSYGNTYTPGFIVQRYRGTKAAPSAVLAGDALGGFGFMGATSATTAKWQGGIGAVAETTFDTTMASQNASMTFSTSKAGIAAEKMRITSNGFVGIGTTAPGAYLDIPGQAKIGVSGRNYFKDAELNTGTGLRVGAAWGMYGVYSEDGAGVIGGVDGVSVQNGMIRVLTNGNVGVGNSSPGYKLDVSGSIRGWGITDSSDIRLKRDVEPLHAELDRLLRLRGVSYYWKGTEHDPSKQLGFIAQEVEQVYPELVKTDQQGMKSVNYSHLVAPIIEGIRELFAKLTHTEERVSAVEAENARLKADAAAKAREIASIKAKAEKAEQENAALKARLDRIEKALLKK